MKLSFEKNDHEALYLQIAHVLMRAMIDGQICQNEKLPSIRELALDLEVSKSTIQNAYDYLISEGYMISKPKSGYYCDLNERQMVRETYEVKTSLNQPQPLYLYDLTSKAISLSSFETKVWRKYTKMILEDEDIIGRYGEKSGELCLKTALRQFLYDTRGVYFDDSQCIIGAGISPLIYFICRLFRQEKQMRVGMIEPNPMVQTIFEDCHWKVCILADIDDLKKVDVLYITSHPKLYKINQKARLMHYVRAYGLYLIEDDYTMEMHYLRQPPSSFYATFKDDRIFYLNSFSKLLLPSIRLACLIVPTIKKEQLALGLRYYNQTASKIEQCVFSQYLQDGHLMRRLKSLRKENKRKYETIKTFLDNHGIDYYLNEPACCFELLVRIDREAIKKASIHGSYNQKNHLMLYFSQIAFDDLEIVLNLILNACRFSKEI